MNGETGRLVADVDLLDESQPGAGDGKHADVIRPGVDGLEEMVVLAEPQRTLRVEVEVDADAPDLGWTRCPLWSGAPMHCAGS